MISPRKQDIPKLTDCERKFTKEIVSKRQPDAFSVELEHVDPKYKFITAAEITLSNLLKSTRVRIYPNDLQVNQYPDHFPFGKNDYVIITDENLQMVFITTVEAQCKVMPLEDYQAGGIDYSKVLKIAGNYYGPTFSRDLSCNSALSGKIIPK